MSYEKLYYLIIFSCAILLPIFLAQYHDHLSHILRFIATIALIVLYLVASARKDGIDFSNYYLDYSGLKTIPDKGYQFFVDVFRYFQISFNCFLFFIGIATIYAIKRVATFFQAPFSLCLLLFLAHSAIVRDFSQMRVGFGVIIFMIGLTVNVRIIKWIFYIFATLVHATVFIGIFGYEVCRFISNLNNKNYRFFSLIAISASITLVGQDPGIFSFIDDRVDIYLNWLSSGYGLPIDSYSTIYLHVGVLLLYLLLSAQSISVGLKMRPLVYLEYLGIVFFMAFSDVAIFAYRITNIITCLYFILVAKCLSAIYLSKFNSLKNRWLCLALGYCILLLLLMRPGSSEILSAISFDPD